LTAITFGFEAEFQENVPALVTALHEEGLVADDEMHAYHCRCESCDFDSRWTYRAQTDSSCGGEVISQIFDSSNISTAVEAMQSLERAAIETDAEPSLGAGFHVHVDWRQLRERNLADDALWAYLRWEATLGELVARGRWPDVRGFNLSLRRVVQGFDIDGTDTFDAWALSELKHEVRCYVNEDEDRHLWLNFNTRGRRTWEFRLFNSTRVAWRMEMYARLALLFVTPAAVPDLLEATPSYGQILDIARHHDEDLVPLLERQSMNPGVHTPFTMLMAAAS
jgi:hypothetical protein